MSIFQLTNLLFLEQPLGQIPVLDVDGVKIPQTFSIARFVAKEAKLAGRNNVEQAQADAVIDTLVDIQTAFGKVYHIEDPIEKVERIFFFIYRCIDSKYSFFY
jgi:hypothetical protein